MQRVSHKAAALQRHSELLLLPGGVGACLQVLQGTAAAGAEEGTGRIGAMGGGLQQLDDFALKAAAALAGHPRQHALARQGLRQDQRAAVDRGARSDEHTSELQSLIRISYACFCLQKNNTKT